MKNTLLNMAVILLMLVVFGSNRINAQHEMNVTPGFGTLNEAVDGDTTATGERLDPDRVYVLQRDGLYLLNGSLSNSGYHLRIEAAAGSGARPILQPAVPTGGSSARPFRPKGDITLKGLYVTNKDELGLVLSRMIRVSRDSVTVTVDDCHIDFASQSAFRIDNDWNKIYITNSIISNIGSMDDASNGRGVDDRGNNIDVLVMENNTFQNITFAVLRDGGGLINKFKFNHNTVYNIGLLGVSVGECIDTRISNNLIVNAGFIGKASDTRSYIQVEKIGQDLITAGVTQLLSIDHNNFYLDPAIVAAQPDSVTPVPLYDAASLAIIAELNGASANIEEAVTFTNAPTVPSTNVTAYWDGTVSPKPELDNGNAFGTMPFNYAYPTNIASYTHAQGGQPLGDLSWFNMVVGVDDNNTNTVVESFELKANYPNPFNPSTTIEYAIPTSQNVKLNIYNSIGQLVKTLVNTNQDAGVHTVKWNGTNVAGSKVTSGIYFYQINSADFTMTRKMILMK